jgi:hypothetical protein
MAGQQPTVHFAEISFRALVAYALATSELVWLQ